MKSDLQVTLNELLEEAVRLTKSPDAPYVAFVEYSGHVNWVSVRVFKENSILEESCYVTEDEIPVLKWLVQRLVSLQQVPAEDPVDIEEA